MHKPFLDLNLDEYIRQIHLTNYTEKNIIFYNNIFLNCFEEFCHVILLLFEMT